MKTKLNLLVILALLITLMGGNVSQALAEEVPGMISNLQIVDSSGSAREPSYVGESIYAQADITGLPADGALCSINYGGDMGTEDVVLTSSDTTCKSQSTGRQYPAPGTYTVTMTLHSLDGLGTLLATSTIQHEVGVGVGDIVWVDRFTGETTTTLVIGRPYTIKAPILGFYEGLTCGIFFGDETDEGGTLTDVDGVTWCSANKTYGTAGDYTVEFWVYNPDGSDTVASNIVTFMLSEPSLGIDHVYMMDSDLTMMLEPTITNEVVTAVGFVRNPIQYALIQSCTVDYGDGGGDQTGLLGTGSWDGYYCQGPVHTYTTAGTYTVTVTVTGIDGATAEKTTSHLVLPPPVLEQLPNRIDGLFADSKLWGTEGCKAYPCSGAENIVVPEGPPLTISHIQLWGIYAQPGIPYVDDFTVIIHQDEAGLPGESFYTEQHVPSLKAPLGFLSQEYLITLTLTEPQTLPASTYWIEIYNNNGTISPEGYLINAFGWILGFSDTLGLGQDGLAGWYPSTQTWSTSPLEYNLSLRLFSPSVVPTTHSISGKVFDDLNINGAYDDGELGLEGVTVKLDQGCNGPEYVSTTTGADGSYSFTAQAGQEYCVVVMPPEGYKYTLAPASIASLDEDVSGMDYGFTTLDLFSWTPATPLEGGSAEFTALMSGFDKYDWRITQPDTACNTAGWLEPDATGQTANLSFGASGQYQVCLRMEKTVAYTLFDSQLVTVANVAPEPLSGSIFPEPSEVGQPITDVSGIFYDVDQLASCTIDFGDGTAPVTGNFYEGNICEGPAHTYTSAGTYTVTFTVTDPDGAEGILLVTHVVNPPPVSADLSLTKLDSKDPVKPGASLVYTLTVKNLGPNTAESVVLTDKLDVNTTYGSVSAPRGWTCKYAANSATVTCTAPSLASGSSAVIKITVTVSKTVKVGRDLVNNATVLSATYDPDMMNNTVTQKTRVAK